MQPLLESARSDQQQNKQLGAPRPLLQGNLEDDDSGTLSRSDRTLGPGSVSSASVPARAAAAAAAAPSESGTPNVEDLVFFRIVSNNMSSHTFVGEVNVQDIDCMVQVYKVVASTRSASGRTLETVSVTPVPTMIHGAAWLLRLMMDQWICGDPITP